MADGTTIAIHPGQGMTRVLELKYLKDLPEETYRSTTMFTAPEQAQAWGEKNGAHTVYIFFHTAPEPYMEAWLMPTEKTEEK
jgi:hypothetical protein